MVPARLTSTLLLFLLRSFVHSRKVRGGRPLSRPTRTFRFSSTIGQASHTKGAKAIQWTCEDSHPEQEWFYDSAGRLWNKESNLCLSIPEASLLNSVTAIQWTCEDPATHHEQLWVGYYVTGWTD